MLNPDPVYLMILLLTAVVLNSLFLDTFIQRLETQLLNQMIQFMNEVRHAYHRHSMVEEAIEEAAELSAEAISSHGYIIADALKSSDPHEELNRYYETAPSRFLKSFAGISLLIMEYGDKVGSEGSMYLKGLNTLNQEIQLEIIRRAKLDYVLKGLHFIALFPVFFTKPVEMWARKSFPLMEEYYLGRAGMLTKLFIYVLIMAAYTLLQKLKNTEDASIQTQRLKKPWEQLIYNHLWFRRMTKFFIPEINTRPYLKISQLLKDTNHILRVEWFYVRRMVLAGICGITVISCFLILHVLEINRIQIELPRSTVVFGSLSKEDKMLADRAVLLDTIVIHDVKVKGNTSYDEISHLVAMHSQTKLHKGQFTETVNRIYTKLQRMNSEYLKWWEVVVALILVWFGYELPVIYLRFQRRIRQMDMKHEVYQLQSIIVILKEMDRISVEEILHWMSVYALIFRTPLEKCLLHFEHGAEVALHQLKDEVTLPEFKRLIEKLILAVERIPIAKAFDNMDGEMSFRFEERRISYEKMLDIKSNWGRMIGFTPMYALVFLYLVVPLIWMSFTQMTQYYDQIQKL
ncbi:hypothetical protein J2Z69_000819 [Paenibacillus shirakamiensis]|uniref:Uncharacterized protein n=1 Tax=Paenibacillus shirakamiensis TaxID=1265935 RepID=A0ABS4JDP3_9BACL|nr:hypothetical protein [Paenibacillus shirakamiensis]